MANPLDREINAALRKGREPESWKRPGARREGANDQRGNTGQAPTGQSGNAPDASGINRPEQKR